MGLQVDAQNWLGDLYDRHGAGVYRYLAVLLGRKEDAEDVMQTIFVKLARNPDRLGGILDPQAYLFAAARNEGMSLLRKRSRKEKREVELEAADYLIDRNNPSASQDELQELNRALQRLSPEQRETVALHTFEAMTFDEIGRLFGLSVNTVVSRYRLGLKKLKKVWKREQ